MIDIKDKKYCCGCHACANVCPKHCIDMNADEQGFLYPNVDTKKCIDCGLCEKVCPVINQSNPSKPIKVYAAKNTDEEILKQSSSGGIFTLLAEKIINDGGIVFGAKFDAEWNVVHSWTDTIDGISDFRGSKYVQSTIGNTYSQAKEFLEQGRYVLFSGTPCQIAGLKKFLRKEYDKLITAEVVCHGVPSPKIWNEYLNSLQIIDIGTISHKDKRTGWRSYSFSIRDKDGKLIYTEKASENKYLSAFIRNLTLRPSCFSCPSKSGKCLSDLTLADFWGIEYLLPHMDDNKGTSFICVNTQKGIEIINQINIKLDDADYKKSIQYNLCIEKSVNQPAAREKFWEDYMINGIKALPQIRKENVLKRIIKRLLK